jgi:hypothetical protein
MKSVAAFSFALSEIVRITPNGIPSSKHTCATAAPSISTANNPGKCLAKGLYTLPVADELVPATDEAPMHARRLQSEYGPFLGIDGVQ